MHKKKIYLKLLKNILKKKNKDNKKFKNKIQMKKFNNLILNNNKTNKNKVRNKINLIRKNLI